MPWISSNIMSTRRLTLADRPETLPASISSLAMLSSKFSAKVSKYLGRSTKTRRWRCTTCKLVAIDASSRGHAANKHETLRGFQLLRPNQQRTMRFKKKSSKVTAVDIRVTAALTKKCLPRRNITVERLHRDVFGFHVFNQGFLKPHGVSDAPQLPLH